MRLVISPPECILGSIEGLPTFAGRTAMPYSEQIAQIGTHGLLDLATCTVYADSKRSDWSSVYVSRQTEQPFSHSAAGRPLGLFVVHLNGPVEVHSRFAGRGRSSLVPSGAVTYWPPGNGFDVETQSQLDTIHLYLDPAVITDSAERFCLKDFTAGEMSPIFAEADEVLRGLIVEVADLVHHTQRSTALYVDQIAQTLASRLIYRGLSPCQRSVEVKSGTLGVRQMRRISQYIAERLDSAILIQDLADLVDYSPSHFSRTFTKTTGFSPYQYVLNMRIEAAKGMLLNWENSIIDIALDCGFASQEHFSRTFRKFTGLTPMGFRKSARF